MPRDMAMDEPSAGIIRFESNGDKSVEREQNYVTPRRVVELQIEIGFPCQVERLSGLLQEGEVVAMQVDLERVISGV